MKGIILDQAADSEIQMITYRDGGRGTKATVGLSLKLPGGGIWARNLFIYDGRVEIAGQNATISDSTLFGGLQTVGAGINMLVLGNCQIAPDPNTGYSIYSNTTAGSFGTAAMVQVGGFMVRGPGFPIILRRPLGSGRSGLRGSPRW